MIQPSYDGGRPGIYVPSSYTAELTEPSVEGVDWPAWLSLGAMAGHTALLGAIATQDGGAPAAEAVVNEGRCWTWSSPPEGSADGPSFGRRLP